MLNKLAPSSSLRGRPQYGLVSLRDMYNFHIVGWVKLLDHLSGRARIINSDSDQQRLPKNFREIAARDFDELGKICKDLGLLTAASLSEEMHQEASGNGYTGKKFADDLVMLRRTILANMNSQKFMRLSAEYAKFAEEAQFGEKARDAFPRAIRDMEEAGKALAYGLGTASVFHLMRVMEAALKEFANGLGIPYAPSWESYLRQLEDNFSEKHKLKTAEWKRDEPYYREVAGDLQIVKLVWRNPTMHIVRSYTQEEAREIFSAVCAFVTRLAERFSEADSSAETL